MKKMYNNPKTEAVELSGDATMVGGLGVASPGVTAPEDIEGAAPARKGNPLQGQIKM